MPNRSTVTQIESIDRRRALLPTAALLTFAGAVIAVILIALVSYRSFEVSTQNADRVTRTIATLQTLEAILSAAKDAETGQRGFLLTGTESYLEPYTTGKGAIFGQLDVMQTLLRDNAAQQQRLTTLRQAIADKFDELDLTISLRREGSADAAMTIVR
jgi:CHASE3 domain sensor protein